MPAERGQRPSGDSGISIAERISHQLRDDIMGGKLPPARSWSKSTWPPPMARHATPSAKCCTSWAAKAWPPSCATRA